MISQISNLCVRKWLGYQGKSEPLQKMIINSGARKDWKKKLKGNRDTDPFQSWSPSDCE